MTPALLLAALVMLPRLPFRSVQPFNWDAANFALAVQHFDVRLHQPHPPGYPYYVALGALFNLPTHDVNAALVAVSVLLECVAVAALYLLGRAMFSPWAGAAAAIALTVSVTFWTYGEIALAYPALAAFATLVALFVYQTRCQGRDRLLAAAAAYAIGTGFRPDLAAFLLPLLAFGAWGQPRRRILQAAAVACCGVLLWLLPVMLLSGGPATYLQVFAAYAGTDVVERYAPTALGWTGLLANLRDTVMYIGYALYADAAVVIGVLGLAWRRPLRDQWPLYGLLVVWLGPMAAFYLLVHIGDPGYVFGLLPALLLAGIGGWRALAGPRPGELMQTVLGGGMALAVLANTLLFLLYDQPLTLAGVRRNDVQVQAQVEYVRALPPSEVMLVTYDSHRQFTLLLPEYQHSVWLDTTTPARQAFGIPPGVRWLVFTDDSVFFLLQSLPAAEADYLPGKTWIAKLPVTPPGTLVYEAGKLSLAP